VLLFYAANREIQLLRKLNHKNIVKLKAVASNHPVALTGDVSSEIYFVLEYVEHDLAGILSASQHFAGEIFPRASAPQLMQIPQKLNSVSVTLNIMHFNCSTASGFVSTRFPALSSLNLTAPRYCHAHNVLHRDIKASNLLISKTGELKIADFGLARLVTDKRKDLTPTVITLWYRPPEILLGLKKYDSKADMWSVGCVLAELLNGRPLFPASSEPEMLKSIWNFCGYPSEKSWPQFKQLLASGPHRALFANFKPSTKDFRTSWRELRPDASELELQLLSGLLHLDPQQRLSADEAALHKWFGVSPLRAAVVGCI
jgi:serine/threonine protein kinase